MRIREKYFLICSAIILSGVALSFGTLSESESEKQISDNNLVNDEIVKMYEELIELRQRVVIETRRRIDYGTGHFNELVEAEIKAAEARIELARFQDQKNTVIKELENLVQVITKIRKRLNLEMEMGQRPQSEIYEIDARVLEIKIQLAKLKADYFNPADAESKSTTEFLSELKKIKEYESIQLRHIGVDEAALSLRTIIDDLFLEFQKRNILIQPLVQSRKLLVFGKKQYRDMVRKLVKEIDNELFANAQEYDIIPINYSDVNEVTDSLHRVFKESKVDYINKITIVPLPEYKALLIYGYKSYCDLVRKLTKEILLLNSQLQRKTFQLKYANTQDVKNKLDELFGEIDLTIPIQGTTGSGSISKDTVITIAYPSLKQIVVLASEDKMREIEKLIAEWDIQISF